MRNPSSASEQMICPICESAELHRCGHYSAHCPFCDYVPSLAVQAMLRQIVALPDVLGRHACECGHPEMRRLPDGVFHCPACGSQVLPHKVPSVLEKDRSERRREDWSDVRVGRTEGSTHPTGAATADLLGHARTGGR